ncbi:MAG: hypothetical protein KA169_03820, partial [Burkholderiaceae bacterium]|nr:hypothetical protein [Burkholderiaceae bacterium]
MRENQALPRPSNPRRLQLEHPAHRIPPHLPANGRRRRCRLDRPAGPRAIGLPQGPPEADRRAAARGAADIIARTGAALLEKSLKQSVVVENKPGGQFQISMQALLNAPAD